MMSFCKRSVHSFLGLTNSFSSTDHHESPRRCGRNPCLAGGLSLIAVTGEIQRSENVVESAAVKSPPPPPSTGSWKRDPGGIGFNIEGVDVGLMSCTESLGFESSDERRVDDGIDREMDCNGGDEVCRSKWRKKMCARTRMRREVKKFPPPLSSLNKNGQPSFFLRPVRKDGRLELTAVRIDRPEILHASRQDGRLILHLIRDDQDIDNINIEEHVEEQEQEEEEDHEEKIEELKEEKEEERVDEWQFPVITSGSSDGFRRCHELVNHQYNNHHHHHHHHHSNNHLHVWNQHCVTTR